MMTAFEVFAIISPVASILFTFFAFRRNQKNDDGQSAREMGQILTEIGYIKSQNDELKRKFENNDSRYVEIVTRVSKNEAAISSAHHRIDTIMDGIGFKDGKNT